MFHLEIIRRLLKFVGKACAYGARPIVFEGKRLVVHTSASAAGLIKVVLLDADGKEYPGFGINDAQSMFGDTIEREVQWKGAPDLSQLAGRPVEIRFILKEADLFSFWFR